MQPAKSSRGALEGGSGEILDVRDQLAIDAELATVGLDIRIGTHGNVGVATEGAIKDPVVEEAIKRLDATRLASKESGNRPYIEREKPEAQTITVVKRDEQGREVERKQFTIEAVDHPEHPTFDGAYGLMADRFGSEELDPEDIMKDQMRGLRYGYEMGTRAMIFAIKDDKGEVVTVLDGGVLPLLDEQGKPTKESVFMTFYVATKPELEGIGLGREVMITAYQAAAAEAQSRGLKLLGGAGECTWTSRNYWEKLGYRRAYTQDQQGNFAEVPYVQPPLAFELETGEVEEGAGDAPEHFMLHPFDEKMTEDPNIAVTLGRIDKAFYRANNYIDRQAFVEAANGDEAAAEVAYKEHLSAIQHHEQQFLHDVQRGPVSFLSRQECEAIEESGHTIEPWYTSDEEREALGQRDLPVSEAF